MENMNKEFLKEAEKITAFNISSSDFSHINYKAEIRYLINKHWFPGIKSNSVYKQTISYKGINESIDKLKTHGNDSFDRLYSYNVKGIGPGEVMLYYMVDKAVIGGGSSAGVDISIDDEHFEVKAVNKVSNKVLKGTFVNNFKLGGTVNLSPIIKDLQELTGINKTELPGSTVNELRENKDFKDIENAYRDAASYYFKYHDIIFMNNSKTNDRGKIISIGKVKPENIFIERMTSGTIKPIIRIDE